MPGERAPGEGSGGGVVAAEAKGVVSDVARVLRLPWKDPQ